MKRILLGLLLLTLSSPCFAYDLSNPVTSDNIAAALPDTVAVTDADNEFSTGQTITGTVTASAFVGDLTGEADTVATITGLAPDTATTQANQPNITHTGTLTSLNVTGVSALGSAVYSTDWADYTPTYATSGSMTFTSVTIQHARWMRIGKRVHFELKVTGTVGGTPSNLISVSVPYTARNNRTAIISVITNGGNIQSGASFVNSLGGTFDVQLQNGANWVAGASTIIRLTGSYETN